MRFTQCLERIRRTTNQDYSAYFCVWNANKRSAIDLKSAEGRDVFMELVPKFDMFVENYRPGVIEKLNIGYEQLKAVNPGLIYARIKGFGFIHEMDLPVHGTVPMLGFVKRNCLIVSSQAAMGVCHQIMQNFILTSPGMGVQPEAESTPVPDYSSCHGIRA